MGEPTTDREIAKWPVMTLVGAIAHAFENPNGSSLEKLRTVVARGIVNPQIDVVMDGQERAPYITGNSPAKICLHVRWLEVLWAFIYGWFVVYEQAVMQRWQQGSFDGEIYYDSPLLVRAAEILEWVRSSDGDRPDGAVSPICFDSDDEKVFTEKANGIFVHAVSFVLHHELGHALLGHLVAERRKGSAEHFESKDMERDADEFAFIALISQNDDEERRRQIAWSVLAPSLCTLYRTEGSASLFSSTHPFRHHRVETVLRKLNFEGQPSQDYFIYLSVAIAQQCALALGVAAVRAEFETPKEALTFYLDELDKLGQH